MQTPFGAILRAAVDKTPGAVGGAFAARDGETVDAWAHHDDSEWAITAAHFGIILAHVQSALHTFHFGDVEALLVSHDKLDVLINPVRDGYYVMLAVKPPAALGVAMQNLEEAVIALKKEMG